MDEGIKNIQIGEIVLIEGREWVLTRQIVRNGRKDEYYAPRLILLKNLIVNISRKPYYERKKQEVPFKEIAKKFKGIKLGRVK